MTQFEHANITVPSINAAIDFLLVAAPDFKVRIDHTPEDAHRWAHVGNASCYFALQEPKESASAQDTRSPYQNIGINHIGMVVENLDAIQKQLIELGYEQNGEVMHEKHGRRLYFYDNARFEWELVEYNSEKEEERYSYSV